MAQPKSEAKLRQEVEAYLSPRRQRDYEQLLKSIEAYLVWLRNRPVLGDIIYRVYSRADKQRGSPLKEVSKIVSKLAKWQRDSPRKQSKPSDVHDIIGATIVVYYDSQLNQVRAAFEAQIPKHGLQVIGEGREHRELAYHAFHYTIGSTEPLLTEPKAEIQIKSLLYDGWGAKTHDLIYKPKDGSLPESLRQQAELLAESVGLLEKLSDGLRRSVEAQWAVDAQHRKIARATLAMTTRTEKDRRYVSLMNKIDRDASRLAGCDSNSPLLRRHLKQWGKFSRKSPPRNACRALTFLAFACSNAELAESALARIEYWISVARAGEPMRIALHFKALALHQFGMTSMAIETGRETVEYCVQHQLSPHADRMNLAYFIAEHCFKHRHQIHEDDSESLDRFRTEANRLIATTNRSEPIAEDSFRLDSKGFVEIAFARTAKEIRSGLDKCRVANALARKNATRNRSIARAALPNAQAYLELHEMRAAERLRELAS